MREIDIEKTENLRDAKTIAANEAGKQFIENFKAGQRINKTYNRLTAAMELEDEAYELKSVIEETKALNKSAIAIKTKEV